MDDVRCETLCLGDFRFESGATGDLTLAIASAGPQSRHPDTATWLLLHGYAGSHFAFAGLESRAADGGWAASWAGPGLAIDTDIHRVVSINLPGSSYGSSVAAPDGAVITVEDMASACAGALAALGIERAAGVIGYSFGGYVALAMKRRHPARVGKALGICTGTRGRGSTAELANLRTLTEPADRYAFRMRTLMSCGLAQWGAARGPAALQAERERVTRWSAEFGAESLWRLRAAAIGFGLDRAPDAAHLLFCSSDTLFPADAEPALRPGRDGARPAAHSVIRSDFGHQSLLYDPSAWSPHIAAWSR